jgi:hypothetical protein
MIEKYVLLVRLYRDQKVPEIMNTKETYITAIDKTLLLDMGEKLKKDGLVYSYQLAKLEGVPL